MSKHSAALHNLVETIDKCLEIGYN